MNWRGKGLLIAAAVMAVVPARADNLALRATPGGVEGLDRLVPLLPSRIDIPPFLTQYASCVGTTGVIDVRSAVLDIDWQGADLEIRGDRVHVEARGDVSIDAEVRLQGVYCVSGTCQTDIRASGVRVVTDIALDVAADRSLHIDPQDITVELADVDVDIGGCFAGEVAEVAIDAMDAWATEFLASQLANFASDGLRAMVADLPLALPAELRAEGYTLFTEFFEAVVDAEGGVHLVANARLGFGESSVDVSDLPAPTEAPFSGSPTAAFEVAASDSLVSSALRQAWAAGVFHEVLSGVNASFEITARSITDRLGLPSGTQLDAEIDVAGAPVVEFGRGQNDSAVVILPELTVRFTIRSPGAEPGAIGVSTTARIVGSYRIDERGALVVAIDELTLDRLTLASGQHFFDVDPARLELIIADVVLPVLDDTLASIPLAPVVSPIPDLHVWIHGLRASGGWLRASFELFTADPDDDVAPDTSVEDRNLVRMGLVTLPVTGTDDRTPGGLLRYQAYLDGVRVYDQPVFTPVVRFQAEDGEHVLEVEAIDLSGNRDPIPARLELSVDGQPPSLTLLDAPAALVPREPIVARWTASDERPGVTTHWAIYAIDADGDPGVIIAEGDAGADGELRAPAPTGARLYILRVVATDVAGNVTSTEAGFAVQGSGCSAAWTQTSSGWPLAVLALAALRRRRRRS